MQFDAQIQMIVSTFKLSQTLEVDPETGKASMRYRLKCNGGARSSYFEETQAVISVIEAARLPGKALGTTMTREGQLQTQIFAPRDYFIGLIQLFPHCRPEEGGYLSFDLLMNREPESADDPNPSERMQVLSAEYKMVKQLSDNPDLISRS